MNNFDEYYVGDIVTVILCPLDRILEVRSGTITKVNSTRIMLDKSSTGIYRHDTKSVQLLYRPEVDRNNVKLGRQEQTIHYQADEINRLHSEIRKETDGPDWRYIANQRHADNKKVCARNFVLELENKRLKEKEVQHQETERRSEIWRKLAESRGSKATDKLRTAYEGAVAADFVLNDKIEQLTAKYKHLEQLHANQCKGLMEAYKQGFDPNRHKGGI